MNAVPLVVDVKRHSLEDGPGIRSVVFFKGCPLRCVFCHSPESQDPRAEVAFSSRECIECGKCADVCPEQAASLERGDRIDRSKCDRCGKCAEECPGNGLRLIGRSFTVDALAEVLLRDILFYRHSGGGVMVSGGECTLYPDYLGALLERLKAEQVHVVLETCGHFDYEAVRRKILPHTDLIYYDVKIADPAAHRKYLGTTNDRILGNLRSLLRGTNGVLVHPRIPLVPGVTATRENLAAIVDILCDAGADDVSLLSYNPLGIDMASCLGRSKPPLPERFMDPDEEARIRRDFAEILDRKRRA